MQILPIFVSLNAYIAHSNWLLIGLAIWRSESFSFERDYFLPLPQQDLQGAMRHRAEYSDAAAFTQRLFRQLARADGTALLQPQAVPYWTEHSDRSGVNSWLAALGVRREDRDFLGRWAVRISADAYVRTATRVIENLQVAAALHAQSTLDYGPDFFGEEHSLEELRTWLSAKGVHPELAEDQIQALTSANNTLEVEAHRVPIEPFGQENKRFRKDHGQPRQNGSEDTVSL